MHASGITYHPLEGQVVANTIEFRCQVKSSPSFYYTVHALFLDRRLHEDLKPLLKQQHNAVGKISPSLNAFFI